MISKGTYINPFPGLRSFDSRDAKLFFGRENHIKKLRDKLNDSRFLAIIGSSGSGKSSLVKAGLIPSLENQNLDNSIKKDWHILILKPGKEPFRNLIKVFTEYVTKLSIENDSQAIINDIEALIQNKSVEENKFFKLLSDKNTLIFIDQFEEIFRYNKKGQNLKYEDEETALFIDFLVNIINQQKLPIYVALTMRSDYLDACTNYNGLTEIINKGYYLLPKMNLNEVLLAITGPLEISGVKIETKLVDRLLKDLDSKTDQLPIFQHALMRMWNYWQANKNIDQPIDENEYEAIGTMNDSLNRHAEEIYQNVFDSKRKAATENIFKSLTVLGTGDLVEISPTTLADIKKITGLPEFLLLDILDHFREQGISFLSPSYANSLTDSSIIDLTHERIAYLWTRLKTWIEEENESANLYRKLSLSADLNQQGKTGLWVNPELQIGLKWLKENRPTKDWAFRYDPNFERAINYLDYSQKVFDFEVESNDARNKKEVKRAHQFAIILGVGSLLSVLFLIVSVILGKQAEQSEKVALSKEKLALIEQRKAELQKREAVSQKRIAEQQEEIAEGQKKLTEEQKERAEALSEQAQQQQLIAENQTKKAKQEERNAKNERTKAENAKLEAEDAKQIALDLKEKADKAKTEAETQKGIAVNARKEAEQQKVLAIVRSIAIQSTQMPDKNQDGLAALLALQAYNLNIKNKGEAVNPDIFNALSKSAESDARLVIRKHDDVVRSVAVDYEKNDNFFASCSDDATVKLWDNSTDKPLLIQTYSKNKSSEGFRVVTLTNNTKRIIAGGAKGSIFSLAVDPKASIAIKGHNSPVSSLIYLKNNSKLVSIATDGSIRNWLVSDTRIDSLNTVNTGFDIYCAKLSPDGNKIACGSRDKVLIFDVDDLKKAPNVYENNISGRITAITYSNDGKKLLTGNSSGMIYQWSIENGKVNERSGVAVAGRHSSTVSEIVFSPDGKWVASSSFDWTVHLFKFDEIGRQKQPIIISDYNAWVYGVKFSKDSKQIIANGADRTIRVWDVDIKEIYQKVAKNTSRKMTVEEWDKYIGKDVERN